MLTEEHVLNIIGKSMGTLCWIKLINVYVTLEMCSECRHTQPIMLTESGQKETSILDYIFVVLWLLQQ